MKIEFLKRSISIQKYSSSGTKPQWNLEKVERKGKNATKKLKTCHLKWVYWIRERNRKKKLDFLIKCDCDKVKCWIRSGKRKCFTACFELFRMQTEKERDRKCNEVAPTAEMFPTINRIWFDATFSILTAIKSLNGYNYSYNSCVMKYMKSVVIGILYVL